MPVAHGASLFMTFCVFVDTARITWVTDQLVGGDMDEVEKEGSSSTVTTTTTRGCAEENGWKCTVGLEPKIPLNSNSVYCSCTNCKFIIKHTSHWTKKQKEEVDVSIKIGDRVMVQGRYTGIVKYVGDLDSEYINDQVYIGVKLDEPVGDNDGTYKGKRFFKCPELHGVIVPIYHVHILVPRDGRKFTTKARVTKYRSRPYFLQEMGLFSEGLVAPEAQIAGTCIHQMHKKVSSNPNAKLFEKRTAEDAKEDLHPTTHHGTTEEKDNRAISKNISLPKLLIDDGEGAANDPTNRPERKSASASFHHCSNRIDLITDNNVGLTSSKYCQTSGLKLEKKSEADQKENPDTQHDEAYSRALLSGLGTGPAVPYSFSSAIDAMENLKKMVKAWGGGEKGFRMAFTLQKLQAAKLKGVKELEWQKELLRMNQDAEFAARRKEIYSLKEEIFLLRKKVANVDTQIQQKELLKRPSTQGEISEIKLRIEKLSKKNSASFKELFHHPMAINGGGTYIRETIARITKEFRLRRKNLSAPQCGNFNF